MKRLSALLMALCLMFLLAMPLMAADEKEELAVSIENATVQQGYTFDVPVTVTANPGIFGCQLDIYYDSQILRFDGLEAGDAFAGKMDLLSIDAKANPVVINYMANDIANVDATGLIATIHFKAYVGARLGNSNLTVQYKPGNVITADSEEVPVNVNDAVVTVTEGITSTDNPDDLPPKESTTTVAAKAESTSNHSWIYFVIGGIVLIVAIVLIWLFAGSDAEEMEPTQEDVTVPPDPVEPEKPDEQEEKNE